MRNVDAKHTSVSALPVNPFRMSTANDIMSVRQPATGEKNMYFKNDEGFFLRGGIFLLEVFFFCFLFLRCPGRAGLQDRFQKTPALRCF